MMLRIRQRHDNQDKPLILALYITQNENQQSELLQQNIYGFIVMPYCDMDLGQEWLR